MSITNPDKIVTEERLSEFYQQILPYLGGMPDILANKFSKSDLYSTSERMIGQWIDGKPLYQKTITMSGTEIENQTLPPGFPSNYHVYNYIFTGIQNGENARVVSSKMIGWANELPWANLWCISPYCSVVEQKSASDTSGRASQYITDDASVIYTGIDKTILESGADIDAWWTSGKKIVEFTIQYTKTTDSAISIGNDTDYSTTEKIVGTWIDGKPIYQKTINFGTLPTANSSKSVAHNISNIDHFCSVQGIAYQSSGITIDIPYSSGLDANNKATFVNPWIDKTAVHIDVGIASFAAFTAYITLQYTKTTD